MAQMYETEGLQVAEAFAARLDGARVFFVRVVGAPLDLLARPASTEALAAGVAAAAGYPVLRQAGVVNHAIRHQSQRVFVFAAEAR